MRPLAQLLLPRYRQHRAVPRARSTILPGFPSGGPRSERAVGDEPFGSTGNLCERLFFDCTHPIEQAVEALEHSEQSHTSSVI